MTGKLLLWAETKILLPDFKAERVCVLMMFMPVHVFPERNESEYEALTRLLKANGEDGAKFREWLREWCKRIIPGETHLHHLLDNKDLEEDGAQ